MAGGISVHVVDTTRGRPAKGMIAEIWRLGARPRLLAKGRLSAAGMLDHKFAKGDGVARGVYEVRFDVGTYAVSRWLNLKKARHPRA